MGVKRNKKTGLGRIGILMGGPSSERKVSLKSGKSVYESLRQLGLDVVTIDIVTDNAKENIKLIRSKEIDCAFLALHGRFGEDGQIQEILESLFIPYTGSGVLASRLVMDKVASRKVLEIHGIPVPAYKIMERPYYKGSDTFLGDFSGFPLVVKPATHGSSIGLSIVDKKENLKQAVELAFKYDEHVLIEQYISGRELTVGILNDKALPVIEIIPKAKFFDYEAKYLTGTTEYRVPANIKKAVSGLVQSTALKAHKLLGCYGCSRVDIILSRQNIPFILELNSIPGLTPTSLLPKAARAEGIEFSMLCLKLIKLAYEKTKEGVPR